MTADVVFTFSTETLADAAARGLARPPDRMLQTLCHADEIDGLLVVDAPRWALARLRRGPTPWPEGLGPQRPHHRPLRLARREPTEVDAIRGALRRRDRMLRRAARRAGLSRPAVITFDPLLAGLADLDWAGPVTFYGRDDWASFPPRRAWWPAYEAAYAGLRDRRRGVLAVSRPLLDRIAPTGPHAVIPNGIDPTEWRSPAAPPAWLRELPRPIRIYVGTVDERVDEDLVLELADEPGSTLLVGPCRDDRRALLAPSGARFHVASDRGELAALVFGSDVGLVPHRRSELTEAMSPLKLYEYRAAGLPVAAVDLAPITAEAATDDAIIIAAAGPGGFAAAASAAAGQTRDDDAARHTYIDATSWSGRHAAALDVALRREVRLDG